MSNRPAAGWHRRLTLKRQRWHLPQRLELALVCRWRAGESPPNDAISLFVLDGPDRGRVQPEDSRQGGGRRAYTVDLSAYSCASGRNANTEHQQHQQQQADNGGDVHFVVAVPSGGCGGSGWELTVHAAPLVIEAVGQVCHQKPAALLAALCGRLLLRLAAPALWPYDRPFNHLWPRVAHGLLELGCWLLLLAVGTVSADCDGSGSGSSALYPGWYQIGDANFWAEATAVGCLLMLGLRAAELWLGALLGLLQRLLLAAAVRSGASGTDQAAPPSRRWRWVVVLLLFPTDGCWQLAVALAAGHTWSDLPWPAGTFWRPRQGRPALCLAVLAVVVKLLGLAASAGANAAALEAALAGGAGCIPATGSGAARGGGGIAASGLSWVLQVLTGCDRLRWEMLAGWPGAGLGGIAANGYRSEAAGGLLPAVGDRLAFVLAVRHCSSLLLASQHPAALPPQPPVDAAAKQPRHRSAAAPAGRPAYAEAAVYAAAAVLTVCCCGGQGVAYRLPWVLSVGLTLGHGLLSHAVDTRTNSRRRQAADSIARGNISSF
eukprot:SAG22_NODE_839_length_6905_cov_2.344696_4_plen_547_part_00